MTLEQNLDSDTLLGSSSGRLIPVRDRGKGRAVFNGREVRDFTSWDILGLASLEKAKRAIVSGIDQEGFVPHSSRLLSGTSEAHLTCERRFAKFYGMEAGLLFSSRNQCVLSVVTALFSEGDVVFFEEAAEAPVADACALVGATAIPFRADSPERIELEIAKGKWIKRRTVFAESVSAITGQSNILEPLLPHVHRIGAWLFVDDTAALGLYGPRGASDFVGGVEVAGTTGRFASFDHGLGLSGSCFCGRRSVVDSIVSDSKNLIVENALPPFIASAACDILDYAELQLAPRERLRDRGCRVARELAALGFDSTAEGPIASVATGSTREARRFRDVLLERGFLVDALSAPLEFRERGIVRCLLTVEHTDEDIGLLLESFAELQRRVTTSPF